ncbi:beta-galactosidase [Candidatus Sumerlaeota bacterium]|nr:beta-galactosidase [Candidatus Sumerlaeota bacterium]
MTKRFPPINPKCPHFIHGGDYNPDQWLRTPEVLDEDMRLMKLSGCNTMTAGVFSWASYEPREGEFHFDWLDAAMDKIAKNGGYVVLATPSGSRPAWMSEKYPEVCRVNARFGMNREPHQGRHNHCRTSPVYREKCRIINTKLAERYKDHPALLVWHVSNEYNGGPCHCELCLEAFREWLKRRYDHDLDKLNHAWWTAFWGHSFGEWEQINPVDWSIHGMMLDWNRFNTDQTIDFFKAECEPLRRLTPDIPITTNLMGFSPTLDYFKIAREMDVVSWDSYPPYHDRSDDWKYGAHVSLAHDLNRSLKQKPHMQMECSPGVQNWKPVNKLKRPGLHIVEGLQCIAHGGDSVQYFQWRKNRGGIEKFHGAVVDHYPSENTRVFKEVSELGKILASLDDVVGTTVNAEVAILYDWENRWAIDQISGPRREKKDYQETCVEHYRSFWSSGVSCDVVNEDSDYSKYKLLIAPMLYMVRPGCAERIEEFVRNGGVFVTTYLSGIANESDLCFTNGYPGPLRELMGVWAEEIDALYDEEKVEVLAAEGNEAGLNGAYAATTFCDLVHLEGAKALAAYNSEFYKGRPAATVNHHGQGRAYYIASRNDDRFHADFYNTLINDLKLRRALGCKLPNGVTAQVRTDGQRDFIFILGFNREPVQIDLGAQKYRDVVSGVEVQSTLALPAYTTRVLEPVS